MPANEEELQGMLRKQRDSLSPPQFSESVLTSFRRANGVEVDVGKIPGCLFAL